MFFTDEDVIYNTLFISIFEIFMPISFQLSTLVFGFIKIKQNKNKPKVINYADS